MMRRAIAFIIAVYLLMSCSFSMAERKTIIKDEYYLGAMRVTRCRDYVSLREYPDKTSKVLAKVPLDGIVLYCTNNIGQYAPGKYKKQYRLFIRCEYEGQEGYILKKHLVPAPEFEPVETRQNSDLMTLEEITGSAEQGRKIVLDWKEFNVSVLASYSVENENDENWEYIRVGCFIDDDPIWGYTEGIKQTGQNPNLKAFMGGTEDEPQVYVYDAEYGLTMLDLMDGVEAWTLTKANCSLGDAAVCTIGENTGILYIAGTEGPDPVAISSEGNILWRSEIDDPEVYGPTEIRLNPNDIEVYYESGKIVSLEYNGEVISISDAT